MTARRTFLTKVGASTMTVYILHLFTIPLLEKYEILKDKPYWYLLYSVLMTALITFLYTRPIVKRIYDGFIDFLTGIIVKEN